MGRLIKWGDDKVKNQIKKAKEDRDALLKDVDKLHVTLLPGNKKTGNISYTVSLYPVLDCINCPCANICYDLRHDVINKDCRKFRLINSAIHKADPKRYWKEIEQQIKEKFVVFLRINVGGDLTENDFNLLFDLAKRNQKCTFQVFTKNYNGCNTVLAKKVKPENLKILYSRYPGLECNNPYKLPETHINFGDGQEFTGPSFGAYFCNGNCSECWYNNTGCISAKCGEHIVFNAH